jgi:hypothetical protein
VIGYELLCEQIGIIQSDILIGNLIMNEEEGFFFKNRF